MRENDDMIVKGVMVFADIVGYEFYDAVHIEGDDSDAGDDRNDDLGEER